MKIITIVLSTTLALVASTAFAHTSEEAFVIATQSGVCGDAPVKSAVFIDEATISATCDSTVAVFPAGDAATLLAAASRS